MFGFRKKKATMSVSLNTDAVKDIVEPLVAEIARLEAELEKVVSRLEDTEYRVGSLYEDEMRRNDR